MVGRIHPPPVAAAYDEKPNSYLNLHKRAFAFIPIRPPHCCLLGERNRCPNGPSPTVGEKGSLRGIHYLLTSALGSFLPTTRSTRPTWLASQAGLNPLESLGHSLLGLGEIAAVAIDDNGDHTQREFLTYLRWKLQEIGTLLIEYARRTPNENFGSAP